MVLRCAICVGFNCVYHDLNVCCYGDQWFIKKKKNLIKFHHKNEVVAIFTDITDLIMNKNLHLHPNSSYYQMCISKRQNII